MPALPIAAWLAIAGLAASGASTGLAIADKPSQPSPQDLANQEKTQQQAQANAQALQNKQLVASSQGQAQAQTGGSLTDTGFQDFAASLAGLPGYNAGASNPYAPGTQVQGSQQTTASQQPGGQSLIDMQAILRQLGQGGQQGNITGGSGNDQPRTPSQFFELSNPLV